MKRRPRTRALTPRDELVNTVQALWSTAEAMDPNPGGHGPAEGIRFAVQALAELDWVRAGLPPELVATLPRRVRSKTQGQGGTRERLDAGYSTQDSALDPGLAALQGRALIPFRPKPPR